MNFQALDRMEEIGTCWAAVSELLAPSTSLETVQRDDLAVLLDFLTREYEAARDAFRASITD